MDDNGITLIKNKRGNYNKEEVDRVIEVISENYKKMQYEYTTLLERYRQNTKKLNEITGHCEKYKKRIKELEKQIDTHNHNIMTKTLTEAESLAASIIDTAKEEAALIILEDKA